MAPWPHPHDACALGGVAEHGDNEMLFSGRTAVATRRFRCKSGVPRQSVRRALAASAAHGARCDWSIEAHSAPSFFEISDWRIVGFPAAMVARRISDQRMYETRAPLGRSGSCATTEKNILRTADVRET